MNAQQVFDSIIANDGGTFFMSDIMNDGFDHTAATDGYMVARFGEERVFPVSELNAEVIATYIADHHDAFITGAYFGAWVSDGKVYLDISDRFWHLGPATVAGQVREQIAIWDIKNGTEIVI